MSTIKDYRRGLISTFKGDEVAKLEFCKENSVIDWLDDEDYRKEYERLMVRFDAPNTNKIEGLRGSIIGAMWGLVYVCVLGNDIQKTQYKDDCFDMH